MARYRGSVCRLCRREGEKLFLKGDRCHSEKCAIERREYPPGQHGQKRKKPTEYATQLREKQKVKRIYGMLERQFRRYFHNADRKRGITGDNLIISMEMRLDTIVYKAGFATSRNQARQWVSHCHVLVNGDLVNIPSYNVKAGDVVSIHQKSRENVTIKAALESVDRRGVPHWIELDKDNFQAKIKDSPARADITMPMNEQLIVELYSK